MSEAAPAPDLTIRAGPRPVRRFSRRALAILLGVSAASVIAAIAIAMAPNSLSADTGMRELYSTVNTPTADGLADLPAGYGDLKPLPPVLGPPLPGDLGAPMLQAQREGRLQLEAGPSFDPLAAAPDTGAAERAAAEAELALAARESGLFFTKRSDEVVDRRVKPTEDGLLSDAFAAFEPRVDAFKAAAVRDPNRQTHKLGFLQADEGRGVVNPHSLHTPTSPWQVMAGTIIPASLLTAINSDLPGQVIAQVTEPVYDTATGDSLLIPQGARLIGRYDSVISYGQSRALIVWTRIILPDGSSIQLEQFPAIDGRGQAGLADRVNHHTFRLFSATALASLINISAELGDDEDDRIARAIRDAVQDGASRTGQDIVRRQLNAQPTLTVRPGWRFSVLVQQDLTLKPYGD